MTTIKPQWAISIWLLDDQIHAELPSPSGLSHTIQVPATRIGIDRLLTLLRSRHSESLIGQKGDPTQHHIDKVTYSEARVRRPKQKFTPDERQAAIEAMRKVGII